MRNRIGKGFQFLVGGFELGGAFTDALFQVGIQLKDFLFNQLALGDILVKFLV